MGILLSAHEAANAKTNIIREFKAHDISGVFGVGFDVSQHINFGARLNYGMTNIRGGDDYFMGFRMPPIHNRLFQFSVGYIF